MRTVTRELDISAYREPPQRLPKRFSFRFIPEKRQTMFYGASIDLQTLKNLGAITAIWRDAYYQAGQYQVQYAVEFVVPEHMTVNLGRVSFLRSSPEIRS